LVDPGSLFTPQGNGVIYFTFHLRRLNIGRVLDITTTEGGMDARVVRPRRQAVFPITSKNWFDDVQLAKSIGSPAELCGETALNEVAAIRVDRPHEDGSLEGLIEQLGDKIELILLEHMAMDGLDGLSAADTLLTHIMKFSRALLEPDDYDASTGIALTYCAIYLGARASAARNVR
jgi:hypothetical protein